MIELYKPDEVDFSDWSQKWWKWLIETPASKNPAFGYAQTMYQSDENQPYDNEDVWFLAGALNDGSMPYTLNESSRNMVGVPRNKALFMPVLNFYGVIRKLEKHREELEQRVKHEMDVINPESLYVTINGQEIPNLRQYRAETPEVFPVIVDGKDNVLRMRHVLGRPIKVWAKGDGYWLFLKPPLPAGKSELTTFGSCLQGKIQIQIHYKIDVLDD